MASSSRATTESARLIAALAASVSSSSVGASCAALARPASDAGINQKMGGEQLLGCFPALRSRVISWSSRSMASWQALARETNCWHSISAAVPGSLGTGGGQDHGGKQTAAVERGGGLAARPPSPSSPDKLRVSHFLDCSGSGRRSGSSSDWGAPRLGYQALSSPSAAPACSSTTDSQPCSST